MPSIKDQTTVEADKPQAEPDTELDQLYRRVEAENRSLRSMDHFERSKLYG